MCFHLTFVVDILVICCGGLCNSLLDSSYLGHIDCTPLILVVEGFRLVNFCLLFGLFVEVLNILGFLKLAIVKLHSGRNKEIDFILLKSQGWYIGFSAAFILEI